MNDRTLLHRIDAYLDQVPRRVTRTEEVGPFTVFVQQGNGWRYYARPTPGVGDVTPAEVHTVRRRQRALSQPEAIEWVVELAPSVGPASTAGGLDVVEHPLMHVPVVSFRSSAVPRGVRLEIVRPEDDLALIHAVASVGFAAPGTGIGRAGAEALDAAADAVSDGVVSSTHEQLAVGNTVTVAAWVNGSPVAIGSHNPCDGVTEIVGVATLPAYRRRGLATAVTSALVEDALSRGVRIVCLSADDTTVARVYARLGFETVGTVGAADIGRQP
jgi:GNAT superfamily N-acetyltransferase